MKGKHVLWMAAAGGAPVNATTALKREAINRWNVVSLCERFGWLPSDIATMPIDLLQDIIMICTIRDAKSRPHSPRPNG